MASNFKTPDTYNFLESVDIDDRFISETWLVDRFVGGTLFSCGYNDLGQLGNSNTVYYSSPIQIGALTNWKQISSCGSHSIATKNDGTLWSWGGNNSNGEIGNGTTAKYSSPIQIGSLTNWKQAAKGGSHTIAVKTDGTLWAWGYNAQGQLGNGATVSQSSPIQVGSLTTWEMVDGGLYHTIAVKTDGTLWVWGYNAQGQLGNETRTNYSSPIQIGANTNWKTVSAGGTLSSTATKTDGTAWTWGYNNHGQLGNGTTLNYSSPVQVGSLTDWKQVSIGGSGVLAAIKTDGTMWTCGYNNRGELGNGTTVKYSSPIQIGSLTSWKQVSIGYALGAVKTDGTLWTWGYNGYGALGNGNTLNYSSPIQVGSLNHWKYVATTTSSHLSALTFRDLG